MLLAAHCASWPGCFDKYIQYAWIRSRIVTIRSREEYVCCTNIRKTSCLTVSFACEPTKPSDKCTEHAFVSDIIYSSIV